jgi:hypothetical protein
MVRGKMLQHKGERKGVMAKEKERERALIKGR